MGDPDRLPLTPAQQQTARELGWYAEWLHTTGRDGDEIPDVEDVWVEGGLAYDPEEVDSTVPPPLH